ncbi:hypothetical protein ACROYT_G014385 [Oculina patagonica]
MANHKRGRSLYTYGTPGVGLKFVGDKKEKASKAGRLCASMFKKFVKKHDVGSDSVSQGDQDMNSASGGNSVQPMEIDDNCSGGKRDLSVTVTLCYLSDICQKIGCACGEV